MKDFLSSLFLKFKEYIILILLLSVSLSLLSLNEKPEMQKLRTLAFGTFAFINGALTEFGQIYSNDEKLKNLEKENAELMLKVNRLRQYGLENDELKNLLGLRDSSRYNLIPSSIISKSSNKFQGYMILNVGTEQNVFPEMPVVNSNGLIGIIRFSSSQYSLVRTLRNSNLRAAVKNQRSGFNGILIYDGVRLSIKNIPAAADMKIGDRIVTSEFSTLFPPSIPVGVITAEEPDLTGLLNNVIVEPFVDFYDIDNLFVIQMPITDQVDSLTNMVNDR